MVGEFHKNRNRVAKTSARSLASHFQQVREARRDAPTDKRRKTRPFKDRPLMSLAPIEGIVGHGTQVPIGRRLFQQFLLAHAVGVAVDDADRVLVFCHLVLAVMFG